MILLNKIRLINWYAYTNESIPCGWTNLIYGANGMGKSVILDAMKYCLWGDTKFNNSTSEKGKGKLAKRTILSYTRGLLNVEQGTYMRPAEKSPNVYTHIAAEMHDLELDKTFILGTVIETDTNNNTSTQRYVLDNMGVDDVDFTYTDDDGNEFAHSANDIQERYGIHMYAPTIGLIEFTKRTGLRFNEMQLNSFKHKFRSLGSYNPESNINDFVKNNVAEEKPIDLKKLKKTKENIDKVGQAIDEIDKEISLLDNIINDYSELQRQVDLMTADDIKIAYQELLDNQEIEQESINKIQITENQEEHDKKALSVLKEKNREDLVNVRELERDLAGMDCAKAIMAAQDECKKAEEQLEKIGQERDTLNELQSYINEIIKWLKNKDISVQNNEIITFLNSPDYSNAEKKVSIENFKNFLKELRDAYYVNSIKYADIIRQIEDDKALCQQVIENCRKKETNFKEIPDYIRLKNDINREFERKGIKSEARFACEYVLGITDENWRDVIEGYLGRRRYTILVDPEYYDIADQVLNNSKNPNAHLFNTRLLMKKEIKMAEDSVASFLTITNGVARKYFDYQLGRFVATTIDKVKEYENAMSKEGRVAVAMDGFFINFKKLKYYYLGQEALELNRIKAERRIKELDVAFEEHTRQKREAADSKIYIETKMSLLKECNYGACQDYDTAYTVCQNLKKELKELNKAQENNTEYVHLSERIEKINKRILENDEKIDSLKTDIFHQQNERARIMYSKNEAQSNISKLNKKLDDYKNNNMSLFSRSIEGYKRYLQAGKVGNGGIRERSTRERSQRRIAEYEEKLISDKTTYNNSKNEEDRFNISDSTVADYQSRKNKIWMDDRQEMFGMLKHHIAKYEEIFKNEFALTVLKYCDEAKDDIKRVNVELQKLSFASQYKFSVKNIKDGTGYEKVLEYANILKQSQEMGTNDGQMVISEVSGYTDKEKAALEKEIKEIIDGIINSNDDEMMEKYADYRNYMQYSISLYNDNIGWGDLFKQYGYNSGAELEIPYLLILLSALLVIYDDKLNSTRFVFIDEPFTRMDAGNVKEMVEFMKSQELQIFFCAPDKLDSIGNECDYIIPVKRKRPDLMEVGLIKVKDA